MLRRAQSSETLCAQRSSERSISALNGAPRRGRSGRWGPPGGSARRARQNRSPARPGARSPYRSRCPRRPCPARPCRRSSSSCRWYTPFRRGPSRHNADPASGELLLIADRSDLLGGLLFQRRRVAQGRIVQPADLDHENPSFPTRRALPPSFAARIPQRKSDKKDFLCIRRKLRRRLRG